MSYLSRTELGPLTTTFTPAPACSVFAFYTGNNAAQFWQGQYCYSQNGIRDEPTCWPTATVTAPGQPINGFGLYSPGLHCPYGYQPACTSAMLANGQPSAIESSSFRFQYSLRASETAIGCCPTGMTCSINPGGIQTCASFITDSTIYPAGICGTNGPGYSTVGTLTLASAVQGSASAQAPLIQLVYQSSDLPTTAPISSSTASPSSPTLQLPTATPIIVSQDTGLSNSAKIGIGVGIPVALLLLAALGFVTWLYRTEKRKNDTSPVDLGEASYPHAGKPVHYFQQPAEVAANSAYQYKYDAYRSGPVELNNAPHQHMSELSSQR